MSGPGLTCLWARTLRSADPFKLQTWAESWKSRRLADYIIATSESRPNQTVTAFSVPNSYKPPLCGAHQATVFSRRSSTRIPQESESCDLFTVDVAANGVFGRDRRRADVRRPFEI